MQIKPLLLKCAVGVLSIASTIAFGSQSTQAQFSNDYYYCGSSDGLPTTIYSSEQEDIPLIRWKTTLGERWTPQARCEEVSQRFDRFDRENSLEFLTTGTVNNMPVVCAVSQQGEECSDRYNSDRVLFTLPLGRDPNEALEQLLGFASVVQNFAPVAEDRYLQKLGSLLDRIDFDQGRIRVSDSFSEKSNGDPRSYYNGRTYIDVSKWILRNRRINNN